jgi:alkyl hydroperoxide reductase subunit AhpC
MKRSLLLFILAAGLASGCHKSGIQPGEARISGTFKPAISGYLNVTSGSVLDSAKINKDGGFSITIPLVEPGRAMLFIANRLTNVYLEPGKEIVLNINSLAFPENITFEGALGPVNHYLKLAEKLDQQTAIPAGELYSKEPESFIRFTDSVKRLKIKLLDEYQAKYKEIDPGFLSRARSEAEFTWADQHIQYPSKYQLIKGSPAVLPAGYHIDYLNTLGLNSASNLDSPVFKVFIQDYLDYRLGIYISEHPTTASLIFPESVARFRVIHEEFKDPAILDYLIFTAMDDHLANFGTTRVESFLTDFRLTCKNPDYVKAIESTVAGMEKVGLGKPAPDFTAYTPEGKKVRLSDYFGELLYIGFWASWSEWSLQEIPYFEQLRRDFIGKPVKFLMISLDFEKDKKLWAAIIKKNNFGSIQLMQDPESEILKNEYFLNDFPRYFLIDKDGKMLSAYAPRPTENIAETLNRVIGAAI